MNDPMDLKISKIRLKINGRDQTLEIPGDTPLLWVIREELNLKGTKFGCGSGLCGACTVHLDGEAVRSCQMPVAAAEGMNITTIEGLGTDGTLDKLQEAWIRKSVPQCGYCQSGQLMSAAALLRDNPTPSRDEIRAHMSGNLCRCGAYDLIEEAISEVARSETPIEEKRP